MALTERLEVIFQVVMNRNPGESEFHQAVKEVLESLGPVLVKYPEFTEAKVIERIWERGGSDSDPKGKADGEVMRFCQSFMTELWRIIGEHTDVPAGDIGVGGREIGYLFGECKRLTKKIEAGGPPGEGGAFG